MSKFLRDGLTQYFLNNFTEPPPHIPRHSTRRVIPFQRLEVENITDHQSVRGRGGVIAVTNETHWTGLSRPSWERAVDLQRSLYIPNFAPPSWHSEPAPPNQPPIPSDAHSGCNNGIFFVLTAREFSHLTTAVCRALIGYATTTTTLQCSLMGPILVQSRRWLLVVRKTHRPYNHRRGIFGTFVDDPGFVKLRLQQEGFKVFCASNSIDRD